MISPPSKRAKEAPRRPSRCVVFLPERGAVTVASAKGVTRLRNRAAFLEWLTSPTIARPSSHVWLSPFSGGWDLLAMDLLRAGYEIRLSRRRGEYLGIWIGKAGLAFGELDEGSKGRTWFGGSALDLVDLERGLTPEEETRAAWEQLDELDTLIGEHWPGQHLTGAVASTATALFKIHLERPIGLSKAVAAELTELDAYGGGHIERYCGRGMSFHAANGETPWEVDLASAYPTAMASVPIPGDFIGYGDEGEALDDCTISTCAITVPPRHYPPLRYRIGGRLYYPHGTLIGTWSAPELRAAVAAGCEIERVIRVHRFEDRSDEFGSFSDSLLTFRRLAQTPRVRAFAKALAVQFVGALGSRPKTYRVTTQPEKLSGIRLDRPGLYSEPVFEPSDRQILSAAATVTGSVSGWVGLFCRACERRETPVIYVHTDGGGTLGDPRPALADLEELGRVVPSLRLPAGVRLLPEAPGTSAPGGAWKVEPLLSARCWAPNRRVSVAQDGERRIAAAGISRTLTEEEIEREVARDNPSEWSRGHRIERGVWTDPYDVEEIDPVIAREVRGLIAAQ